MITCIYITIAVTTLEASRGTLNGFEGKMGPEFCVKIFFRRERAIFQVRSILDGWWYPPSQNLPRIDRYTITLIDRLPVTFI